MNHHIVLRVITKLLVAPILLFALYVQFHGDFSAGGGFQAGVILAVGIILYALVFGLGTARRVLPLPVVRTAACLGVLLYAGVGVAGLLRGGNYLDYDVLAAPAHASATAHAGESAEATAGAHATAGQHLGILLVEAGVGLTVASVMILIFYGFAGASGPIRDEEW